MIDRSKVHALPICGFALAAMALAASPQTLAQSAAQVPVNMQHAAPPEFAMPAQEEPFRRIADDFISAAVAGDAAKAAQMISPAIAAKTGREGVDRYLAEQVLPFFAQLTEIGRSVTVTRTAEVTGFVFYMYVVSKTGEHRPFVIYVIEEADAEVVANVLVDNFVEGRHCAKIAAGWKCPDFR